jgi:phosphatidylglycerophosphatase A
MSEPTPNPPTATTSSAAPSAPSDRRKPRAAIAIATAFGLGYLPKAPGTFGSLGGIAIATFPFWAASLTEIVAPHFRIEWYINIVTLQLFLIAMTAAMGLLSANDAARFWQIKDPQRVVIDEVSGQQLALVLGGIWPRAGHVNTSFTGHALLDYSFMTAVDWKYLLLGFILFRVFDIWKPFPARQAESLPGGLGIMADDWVAGIYAALALWIARALGL